MNSYKKYKSIKHNAVKSIKVYWYETLWEETSEPECFTVLRCDPTTNKMSSSVVAV